MLGRPAAQQPVAAALDHAEGVEVGLLGGVQQAGRGKTLGQGGVGGEGLQEMEEHDVIQPVFP